MNIFVSKHLGNPLFFLRVRETHAITKYTECFKTFIDSTNIPPEFALLSPYYPSLLSLKVIPQGLGTENDLSKVTVTDPVLKATLAAALFLELECWGGWKPYPQHPPVPSHLPPQGPSASLYSSLSPITFFHLPSSFLFSHFLLSYIFSSLLPSYLVRIRSTR